MTYQFNYYYDQARETDNELATLRQEAAAGFRTHTSQRAWVQQVKEVRLWINDDLASLRKTVATITESIQFWEADGVGGCPRDVETAIRMRANREQAVRLMDRLLAQRVELTQGLRALRAYDEWVAKQNAKFSAEIYREHTEAHNLRQEYGDDAPRVARTLAKHATDEQERSFWLIAAWRTECTSRIDFRLVND